MGVPSSLDPGDVELEEDEDVRVLEKVVLAPEGGPEVVRVRPGDAHGHRAGGVDPDREERGELREERDCRGVAPGVRGDDEWELGCKQRVDDRLKGCWMGMVSDRDRMLCGKLDNHPSRGDLRLAPTATWKIRPSR